MGKGGPTFKKVGPPCVFAPIPILSVAAVAVALKIVQSGREKVLHRELNLFEHFTRVTCGIFAFLVRDAKVVGRYHHLHLALQLHDGEQTQRDVDLLADRHILEAAAHLGADLAGDDRTRAAGLFRALHIPARQTDGVYNLHHRIGHGGQLLVAVAAAGVGRKDPRICLAAVQDDLLGKIGDAAAVDRGRPWR